MCVLVVVLGAHLIVLLDFTMVPVINVSSLTPEHSRPRLWHCTQLGWLSSGGQVNWTRLIKTWTYRIWFVFCDSWCILLTCHPRLPSWESTSMIKGCPRWYWLALYSVKPFVPAVGLQESRVNVQDPRVIYWWHFCRMYSVGSTQPLALWKRLKLWE